MKRLEPYSTFTRWVIVVVALALGAPLLITAAISLQSTTPAEAAPQISGPEQSPLPDFQPSQQLPAGSAVAFPTDI